MTFLEAALEILKREGKPLHYKELTERAMAKKLLTFVGRTPEVTMQTQLTAAVKKAPGNPFVRVKPGVFGLLRYPEMPPEERGRAEGGAPPAARRADGQGARDDERDAPRADGAAVAVDGGEGARRAPRRERKSTRPTTTRPRRRARGRARPVATPARGRRPRRRSRGC